MLALVKELLTAPQFTDDEKSRRAGLLHILSWAVVIVGLSYFVGATIVGLDTMARLVPVVLVVLAHIGVQWLMRSGRVGVASWLFCLGIFAVLARAAMTTESRELALDALIIVMMIAGLLLGFRAALWFAALGIGASTALWYAATSGLFSGQPLVSIFFAPVVMKALFTLAALFVLYLAITSLESALVRESVMHAERQRSDLLVRRLSQAVEQSPSTVAITDAQVNLEYVNPAFTRISGYEVDELTGKPLSLFSFGTHPPTYYRDLWDTVRDGREWRGEFANRRKDGALYWECASVAPLLDDSDEIAHFIKVAEDVTARQQAENALDMSETRFRELADNIREAFWLFDVIKQRVLYVSPAYEQVWGRSAENLLDVYDEWWESIHPEDREYAEASFAAIVEAGSSEPYEYRIVRPDGEVRWILDHGFAIRDENGQVVRVAGIAEDVTEQRRAEQELRQSERRFRGVVERSIDGIVVTDEQGSIIEWNRGAEQITGLRAENVLQRSLWDVQNALNLEVHSASVEPIDAEAASRLMLETGQGPWLHRVMDDEIRHADGAPRTIQSVVFSIPTEQGFQLASIIRDVTEIKRTERALIDSLNRYRVLFESANDAIFIMDRERVVECNPRASALFGFLKDQLVGKTPFALSPPTQPDGRDSREKALEIVELALQGRPQRFDWRQIREDGTLFDVTVSLSRIEVSGRQLLQAIVHDITDRVRAEALVQRQLMIEHTLLRVSSSFVENVDLGMAMDVSLRALGEYSDVDRVYVFQFDNDMTAMSNTYEWCREGVLSQIGDLQNLDLGVFSWLVLQLQQDKTVHIADVAQLPNEVVDFKLHLEAQDIKSILVVPIAIKNRLFGFLGLDRIVRAGLWREDDQVMLRVVAGILSNALERHQAVEALHIRDWALASASNGVALADLTGNLTYVNNALLRMWGYQNRESMLGRSLVEFWNHPQLAEEALVSLLDAGSWTGEEVTRRRDGSLFTVQILASLILTDHDTPLGVMASFIDITERKRVDEMLQSSLREKEVLLQEIHHRVNNTLQIIQSLLHIQAAHIEDAQNRDMFDESRDRIRSMALVYEKLYRSPSLAHINMDEYVRSLATHLFQSYQVGPGSIELQVDIPTDIVFSIDTAIPCGLLCNELISNALKHAFPVARPHQTDIVFVGLQPVEDQFELVVSDNGVGLPDGADIWSLDSLGMQLVQVWIEQLEAQIDMVNDGGTMVRLTFAESS